MFIPCEKKFKMTQNLWSGGNGSINELKRCDFVK